MSIRRKLQRFNPIVVIIVIILIYFISQEYLSRFPKGDDSHQLKLTSLQKEIQFLRSVLRRQNVPEYKYEAKLVPPIYIITPTYARPQQKAELTRLLNVFLLVPSLHWIIIEDSNHKTDLVSNFLDSCGLPYTHLNVQTPPEWKLRKNDPNWLKPRGVLQRNAGIHWLRESFHVVTASGVVYFADDDNTYSTQLFDDMRWTERVSVWPVGLVGGVLVEKPIVKGDLVTGWATAWRPDRPFATDMAGFAINLSLLLQNKAAEFSLNSKRGFVESDFLDTFVKLRDLQPKAEGCTKVFVWHTRTEEPDLRQENILLQSGRSTNENIEV